MWEKMIYLRPFHIMWPLYSFMDALAGETDAAELSAEAADEAELTLFNKVRETGFIFCSLT